jgi:HD-GYP domain-containing protein (c-di-GMP phosphodiesterase class II)
VAFSHASRRLPMPAANRKISLIVFVTATLLLVGLVPLVLTGWFLSDRSGKELRAAENRYQIQLVQEKATQIEMFGRRMSSIAGGLKDGIELAREPGLSSAPQTEAKLGSLLRDNPDLAALYIKPVNADSLSAFRAEMLNRDDVDAIAANASQDAPDHSVAAGKPQRSSVSGTPVMTFATNVTINGSKAATIVAIASLKSISQSIVGMRPTKEDELWHSGLPIVFVVDTDGEAVFHPDPELSADGRTMTDLKIVQEWIEAGTKVQSALVPFTAGYDGTDHKMIGAYSTAQIVDGHPLGVIIMQDEDKALASVGEMRNTAWMISMIFALMALVIGFVASRFMTAPVLTLVAAAKRIGTGDFSTRVKVNSRTELGTLGDTFNVMTEKIEDQIANLAKAAKENRELFVGTVKALAAAIDGKDKYTRGHSERVARISVAIGKRMGMGEDELETLRISALLHDVGKIAIDDSILKKPAALTDEEYEIMKTHPKAGYKIMSQIPAMEPYLPGMYMHHEMVNGKGYPQGLTGDQIPLQGKIVSVADTFDAMTIDRPYSKGMQLGEALERLRSFVGTRYQSDVVEALIEACNAGEVANGIVRQMAEKRAAEAESDSVLELVA